MPNDAFRRNTLWQTGLVLVCWVLLFGGIVHWVERSARPLAIDARESVGYRWLDSAGQPVPGAPAERAARKRLEGYVVAVPEGAARIRFDVDFEVADPTQPQALFLAIREEISEIRINGQVVQSADPVPRMAGLLTSEPALYVLSPRALRAGTNHLEIDKQAVGLSVALSEFAVGPAATLAEAFRLRNFLLTDLALIGVGILVFTLLLCLVVNWPEDDRPRIRSLMLLLACCAASTAFLTFSPPVPMGLFAFVIVWTALNLISAAAILAFVLHEVRHSRFMVRNVFRGWLILQVLFLIAFAVLSVVDADLQFWLVQLVNAGYVAVCLSGSLAVLLLAHALVRDRFVGVIERSVLVWCLGALVLDRVGSIVDLHSPIAPALPLTLSWSPIVGAFLGLSMVFGLAREAALARRTVIDSNRVLAERLAVREGELAQSYADRAQMQKQAAVLEERARIVRDMHDGIGGKLAGLRLQASRLSTPAMEQALDDSLTDLRLIVDSLDTAEDGLGDALMAFERRIRPQVEAAQCRLVSECRHDTRDDQLGPRRTLQVLRLLQEAVTNALRHSGADALTLATRTESDGSIRIVLRDNGRGLDPAREAGIGLASMRHRAASIDGELTFTSCDPGTEVALVLRPQGRSGQERREQVNNMGM